LSCSAWPFRLQPDRRVPHRLAGGMIRHWPSLASAMGWRHGRRSVALQFGARALPESEDCAATARAQRRKNPRRCVPCASQSRFLGSICP
jgi:hypothetical protein